MKAVVEPGVQARHYPERFLVNGVFEPNPERPERIERLLDGARRAGCTLVTPPPIEISALASVHDARYLTFLENAFARWSRIAGAADAVTPNIHPRRFDGGYPASLVAQAGWHQADAGAPIGAHTWESAVWSAACAAHAADLVRQGDRAAYALCRPPGHHAGADYAAGFCYLNNTAIAAERLRLGHPRVAVLDVDLHHGNGTQDIFYRRPDVLTVSIHADPSRFYPFFWGYPAEVGEGAGEGFNLNLPLARGTADDGFLEALDQALERIARFDPGALVVALGLDASEHDPFAGLAVSVEGFAAIGAAIRRGYPGPVVFVQEGGYLSDALADTLAATLTGFEAG